MLIVVGCSLASTRIILIALGVEIYGLYGVLLSITLFFTFINSSILSSAQRFLSFYKGLDDHENLQNTFSSVLYIYLVYAIIILTVASIVGYFLIQYVLSIESISLELAQKAYFSLLLSSIISTLSTPFIALNISDENMNIIGVIGALEALLKLIISSLLLKINVENKLLFLTSLTLLVSIAVLGIYYFHFLYTNKEISLKIENVKRNSKEILVFTKWNLLGNATVNLNANGTNILLNLFFGPSINAAYTIVNQISNSLQSFSNNIRLAFNPQVVYKFSRKNFEGMISDAAISNKLSYSALLIVLTPFFFEGRTILELWLDQIPIKTLVFLNFVTILILVQSLDISFGFLFQVLGEIKKNQIYSSISYGLIIPCSSALFYFFGKPELLYTTQISTTIIVVFLVKLNLLKKLLALSYKNILEVFVLPILGQTVITILAVCFIREAVKFNDPIVLILIELFITLLISIVYNYKSVNKLLITHKVQNK